LITIAAGGSRELFHVDATGNVFAHNELVLPLQSRRLEAVLRWQGQGNVYDVGSYIALNPPVDNHSGWLASETVHENESAPAELGIDERLGTLAHHSRASVAAALTLTPDEQQRLAALGHSLISAGADPTRTGPGQPYDTWRTSPAYQEWQQLVRSHLPDASGSN
jgi:hypothetical protein